LAAGYVAGLAGGSSQRQELLLLAARRGVGIAIVAEHHGHATGQWQLGGSLRGNTDADIDTLETISAGRS
jgi:hypothetical protein